MTMHRGHRSVTNGKRVYAQEARLVNTSIQVLIPPQDVARFVELFTLGTSARHLEEARTLIEIRFMRTTKSLEKRKGMEKVKIKAKEKAKQQIREKENLQTVQEILELLLLTNRYSSMTKEQANKERKAKVKVRVVKEEKARRGKARARQLHL